MRFTSIVLLISLLSTAYLRAQNYSIILGRPTNTAITASILIDQDVDYYIEYGLESGNYTDVTPTYHNITGVPDETDITGLSANNRYYYRVRYRLAGGGAFAAGEEYFFHTQRAPGSTFRFDLEADEHLYDIKGVRNMYQVTLANQAKDTADFLISLGDIFGDDHTPDETTSEDMDTLHKDYIQYLSQVCHSMPFYVCLGNHEGESGYYLDQSPPENIAVYGTLWRKYYYPNPYPNDFYSGNLTEEDYGMGQPENYYAWTWGDALFVVLDVYRDCDVNEKPQKWDWTLGETQYNWLKTTLENSSAQHKFVFAHHTRGQGRGGIATANGFEWGGYDGQQWKFDIYRPGWAMPIHQLMVANGVDIFFQGHDHLYAREELDGLVYQEVPMPSDSTYQIGVLANADAYTDLTLDGTGHLRVTVTPDCVTVDYIRAYLPADTVGGLHQNGEIAYSYSVGACLSPVENIVSKQPGAISVFPDPAKDLLTVQTEFPFLQNTHYQLINSYGQVVQSEALNAGSTTCQFDLTHIVSGIYTLRCLEAPQSSGKKVVVLK